MAAILECFHAGFEILLVRVRIDIGKNCAAETGVFQDVQCRLGDRHRC